MVGAGLIMFAGFALGGQLAEYGGVRIKTLEALKTMLFALKSGIEAERLRLCEALELAANAGTGVLKDMFESAAASLAKHGEDVPSAFNGSIDSCSDLHDSDKSTLKRLSATLGARDVYRQADAIDAVIKTIDDRINKLCEKHEKDRKLYRSLCPLIGVLVCVILM